MKVLLLLVLAPLAVIFLFAFWASLEGPFAKNRELVVNEYKYEGQARKVKILSWNIAWVYGMGSEGANYRPKDKEHFIQALDDMAKTIKESGADIVLLQEVDFASAKSHHVDQLKYLSEKLGMNRAYAVSWDVNYLPFPYWPISSHFKRVSSGGGILSRFPISSNKVTLWDKPKANPWWYNVFYLFRYTQVADVEINGESKTVVNSHLEAFDKTNRARQARRLVELISKEENVFVVGGDFNTTPPMAKQKKGFEDARDDYQEDRTYEILASAQGIKDALSQEKYLEDEKRWFTFSSVNPSRKLDYIFVDENLETGEFEVIQTPASDHLPVAVEVRL